VSAPGVIVGISALIEFVTWAAPRVRGIASAFNEFCCEKGIEHLVPPDVAAWAAEDARVDAALRAPLPTEPEVPHLRSGDPDK
jgi:hypothetical protein